MVISIVMDIFKASTQESATIYTVVRTGHDKVFFFVAAKSKNKSFLRY